MSLLTLRGLFERLRAPSQSQKGHFPSKMKLKKWHQNSWHWQKSAQSSEIFVKTLGICQSVGVSSRKGEHFPFWTKKVRTKIKPVLDSTPDYKLWFLLDSSNHEKDSGHPVPEEKIFKDDELVSMIDPILATDDKNQDGYIDYSEFVIAQQAAQTKQAKH